MVRVLNNGDGDLVAQIIIFSQVDKAFGEDSNSHWTDAGSNSSSNSEQPAPDAPNPDATPGIQNID